MDLITYETIRQVHRAEKEEPLQTLPTNFYQAVRSWLISKDGKRDSSSLLEVENAKRLLEDIVSRRERKIVHAALRTVRGDLPPGNLVESERKFFDQIIMLLRGFREDLKGEMMSYSSIIEDKIKEARISMDSIVIKDESSEMQLAPEIPKPNGKIALKVLTDMPQFIGADMVAYGPLKEGDTVQMPKEVATILLDRKAAEILQ